jgi:putative hydrolase of the HAD superfamily
MTGEGSVPIRAVLFDLDDTLVPEEMPDREALLAAAERARARFGVQAEEFAVTVDRRAVELWRTNPVLSKARDIGLGHLEGLWGRFDAADPFLGALRDWVPAYRRETWRGALLKHDIRDGAFSTEIGRAFQDERRARMTAFSDAAPVLARLRDDGYKIGLVTNGAPLVQREKLQASGLAGCFDHVVVSGDIGVGKPDVRVFQPALEGLGVRPEEAAMVGNRLERDIQGAKNAGILPVLIRRRGLSSGSGPSPEFEISSLEELPPLLG